MNEGIKKSRDYLFDNYKALLIVSVVIGHFIELASNDNTFLECIKWVIFSYHMPAFVFVSGYFSKKKTNIMKLIRTLIVPYVLFEVIYYFLYVYLLHKETELWLLNPKFTLWYLLAMFVWKIITPLFKKIPGYIWISFVICFVVGCLDIDDNFLTLPRIAVFYPFFLIGTCFRREYIDSFRTWIDRKKAMITLVIMNVVLVLVAYMDEIPIKAFYGRYNYDYLKQGMIEGTLIRFFFIIIALFLIVLYLTVIKEEKCRFSILGERTMPIYLFHGLIYKIVETYWDKLPMMNDVLESIVLIGISILTIWLLSREPFNKVVNWITGK